MENKEDLFNLNNNKKNPKKLLIYGAAVFLVFVIGVIAFALISGKSSSNDNTVIPPQVKEEPIFKEIPIEEKKPSQTNLQSQTTQTKKENLDKNETKNTPQITNNEKNEEVIENKKAEIKQKPVEKITQPAKKIEKPLNKPKEKVISGNYYVQVAALMKYTKPNKKFLDLIKKYGYQYKIYPVTILRNGKKIKINKLLIGPFKTKNEAKKELVKIKKYITQNAFIFKVK